MLCAVYDQLCGNCLKKTNPWGKWYISTVIVILKPAGAKYKFFISLVQCYI